MDRIALKRQGRPDLVFDGFLVAHIRESSDMAGNVELTIYRTRTGKLILASSVQGGEFCPGEMCKALSFASADDVRLFLDDTDAFADVNASLLRRAAQSDSAFRDVFVPMATA